MIIIYYRYTYNDLNASLSSKTENKIFLIMSDWCIKNTVSACNNRQPSLVSVGTDL